MFIVVQPLLRRFSAMVDHAGRLTQGMVAAVFLFVLASAIATDKIGIHAIFGGFMMGAILPKDALFTRELIEKVEDFAVVFLLPIYFAYTGLRTRIGLMDTPEMWIQCGLVIGVATLGKFGGSALASRLTGLGWREAAALGVLMNTRGLMELVILNIGYDLGVIGPALFAMMVIMAIVTTLATTPILAALYPPERFRAELAAAPATSRAVLATVALPSSGPLLVDVSADLAETADSPLYLLHLARPPERGTLGVGTAARAEDGAALAPSLARARARGIEVRPMQFVSRNPAEDINDVARAKGAGLIVMGWHKPVWSRTVLGGTVHHVMREAAADVVVFIDRGITWPPRRILVPFTGTAQDRTAVQLAARIAARHQAVLTVLAITRPGEPPPHHDLDGLRADMHLVESATPIDAVISAAAEHDLTVLGVGENWELEPHVFGLRSERLAEECPSSLLVVRGATAAQVQSGTSAA
jgi:nucleotide-binding universal stress UspA family protein